MTAYYNEIDPKAAAWLRELIKQNLIAPGIVDTRSIEDIHPNDLQEFAQCHFFAGIGVWSYALRQANFPDDRPVWTGSCPCQPFSSAGKRKGTADERHLWPAWEYLIAKQKPPTIFGEQVASKDGLGWLDTVQTDLEGSGYAFGANDLCAAGVGAPHIRQRLWFVAERLADPNSQPSQRRTGSIPGTQAALGGQGQQDGNQPDRYPDGGEACGMADAMPTGRPEGRSEPGSGSAAGGGESVGMADAEGQRCRETRHTGERSAQRESRDGTACGLAESQGKQQHGATQPGNYPREIREAGADSSASTGRSGSAGNPGPTNGLWRSADWLYCRDGKWRPVEPIHVKMVDGTAPDVGYLCSDRQEDAEKVNEILCGLRNATRSETIRQRGAGMPVDVGPSKVLQQRMHGERADEKGMPELEPQPNEGQQDGKTGMRDVPGDRTPARASRGRGPAEQCSLELDDVVHLMSQSLSLAELYGDGRTSKALQTLLAGGSKNRAVQYPPEQTKAIWASLSEEAKNRLRVGFNAARWRLLVPFPLTTGAQGRVARLRGYGNAINAEVARTFIEAYLEGKPATY